jgi:phosphatidylinositol alpha-1,6-mannosyltransferase
MRDLVISPDLFRSEGGIARIMRLYLRALCDAAGPKDEVECRVLLDAGDTLAQARDTVGPRLGSIRNAGGSKLRFAWDVLRAGVGADRIFCGHVHHLILARLATLLRPGARYYLVAHGIEVWRPFTFFEKIALRGAEQVFCVSEYTRRQLLRFLPELQESRLLVLPNTYDPRFKPRDEGLSSTPVSNAEGPRILAVSRLDSGDPYKGIDTVIEAMPLVRLTYPRATLQVVGDGSDRPRLEALVHQLRLAAAVTFHGRISDSQLLEQYEACDLFALPSRKEGFGLVYLEAMSFGKPCLAARAAGAIEVVSDDVGALVEYGNTDDIALGVSNLVRHPRDPRIIRERARSFSYEGFRMRLANQLASE